MTYLCCIFSFSILLSCCHSRKQSSKSTQHPTYPTPYQSTTSPNMQLSTLLATLALTTGLLAAANPLDTRTSYKAKKPYQWKCLDWEPYCDSDYTPQCCTGGWGDSESCGDWCKSFSLSPSLASWTWHFGLLQGFLLVVVACVGIVVYLAVTAEAVPL